MRVLPHSVHRLTYNLVPLMSGNVNLPKLHLNLPRYSASETLSAAVNKMIPSSVFVLVRILGRSFMTEFLALLLRIQTRNLSSSHCSLTIYNRYFPCHHTKKFFVCDLSPRFRTSEHYPVVS